MNESPVWSFWKATRNEQTTNWSIKDENLKRSKIPLTTIHMEVWSPCYGCLEEGDLEEEAWVRVKGLPLSLWTPSILRRVGDECGGFVAMDGPTKRMEDLRWARMLVKTKRGVWPSSIEIEVEKTTYLLPMWWEAMPLIKKKTEDCRSAEGCEEGDDGDARTCRRVEEWSSAGIEAQLRSNDVMDGLPDGKGRVLSGGRIRFGSLIREPENGAYEGLNPSGPIRPNVRLGIRRRGGPSPTPISGASSGGLGPSSSHKGPKGKEIALEESHGSRDGLYMDQRWYSGPSSSGLQEKGAQRGGQPQRSGPKMSKFNSSPLGVSAQSGPLVDANIELEFLRVREMETVIVQKANSLEEWADSALHKEVMRYEALSSLGGLWVSGNSSSSSMITLGRTPEGEFFDHSGEVREICQIDRDSQGQEAEGTRANGSACWELVEFKGSLATAREQEGGSSQNEIQDERRDKDLDWQKSSLARFSHFLGFSTDGLEKEILNFV